MKKACLLSVILHITLLLVGLLAFHWSVPELDDEEMEALPIQITMLSDKNAIRKGDLKARQTKPASIKKTNENSRDSQYDNKQKSELDTDKRLDRWADSRKQLANQAHEAKSSEKESNDIKDIAKEKVPLIEKKEVAPKEPEEQVVPSAKELPKHIAKKPQHTQKEQEDGIDQLIKESLLIDKTRTRGGGQNNSKSEEAGFGGKKDIADSEALAQTLSAKISSCVRSKFNIIALGGGVQTDLKIRIRFSLKEDGSLDNIQEMTVTGGDSRVQEVGKNQAHSALRYCSPFDLPKDKYKMWQQIDMIFDPFAKG